MTFTTEIDDAMKLCLADGMSFAEVTADLNHRFQIQKSRNAYIGRASRLGIKSRLTAADGMKKRFPKGQCEKKSRPTRSPRPRLRRRPSPAIHPEIIFEPLHLTLLELETGHCRYPFGDGPFTFCGCQAVNGSSYCGPHAKLVLNPERDRAHGRRLEAAE